VSRNSRKRNGHRRAGAGHCDGDPRKRVCVTASSRAQIGLSITARRTGSDGADAQSVAARGGYCAAGPHQLDLRVRRIARLDFGLYASPAWIEQFGSPRESSDLKNCDVIDWVDKRPDYPAIRWFTQATDASRIIFRANSPSDRLTAAREGIGVALGPCLVGDTDPGLVRLLPELELVGPEVWLLVHRELADLARVRVVLDVLAQCARADASRFAGRTRLS
jgi:DNA-binding transcriptional LysR family regulator